MKMELSRILSAYLLSYINVTLI